MSGIDEDMSSGSNHDDTSRPPGRRLVPLLPLRDIVVFPHMVVPLFVGREKSIAALEKATSEDKIVLLAAQRRAKTNDPTPEEIFDVGTIANVIQMLRLPDGTVKVLVEAKSRAKVGRFESSDPYFVVESEPIEETSRRTVEVEALVRSVQTTFESYVKLNKRIPPEMLMSVSTIDDPSRLSDTVVAHLTLKLGDKQELLELTDPTARLERLYELMQGEIEILQVEKKIRSRVKRQMEKSQKEYYLNEQMQAIQKELGERDEMKNELQELEEKIRTKNMSEEAELKCKKEMRKLKMMSPMSAEATVVRNYIEWVLSLPWHEYSEDLIDIEEAERILDEDHYGLRKVKDRILEHLAVQSLVEKIKGPILCFVGPPGVGKTSLGRSIARATGRPFVRVSLGGVRDEAEIRGHRRTYIGAMPGKIVQSIKRAGSSNPVFLLDEVDKMSVDFRGDPSSALLEVLDPEQNDTFCDHYLDLDYDLSKVMFLCTANTLHGIPPALQDRLETIRIAGYTEREKLFIAKRYLVPKQIESNGLSNVKSMSFSGPALEQIINRYTREAGVRNLEREIANCCRKVARDVLKRGKDRRIQVTEKRVQQILGPPRFRYGVAEEEDAVGLVNGVAWTDTGGELLTTEVSIMPGKGKLIITGKLGEVMQESAQAAMSYVRSRADRFGIDPRFNEELDVHIHVPEGAIPKDGPSAGITMATSVVSALTRIPVRREVAMTGEITLRGRVLPIGGLKEKALAAHRAFIKKLLIPKENEKDIPDVPKRIRDKLEIVLVDHMDQVLVHSLVLDDAAGFMRDASEACDEADIGEDRVSAGGLTSTN